MINFTRGVSFIPHYKSDLTNEAVLYGYLEPIITGNCDCVFFYVRSEYLEASRDPAKASWDQKASWKMLDKAITWCHSRNIKLHVVYGPNKYEPGIAKVFPGQQYNMTKADGTKDPGRLEIEYTTIVNYQLDIIKYLLQDYDIDGLMLEEPYYYSTSHSPPIVEKAGGTDKTALERAMMDAWNAFYKKLRDLVNQVKPGISLSMNTGTIYSTNTVGIDQAWIDQNKIFDFYMPQTTGTVEQVAIKVKDTIKRMPNTVIVPGAYITSSSKLNSSGCKMSYSSPDCYYQDIFKIIEWEHNNGSKACFIFRLGYFKTSKAYFPGTSLPGNNVGEIIGNIPRPETPTPPVPPEPAPEPESGWLGPALFIGSFIFIKDLLKK